MIHHEQQQVPDLCFDGSNEIKRVAASTENRGSQNGKNLALIPIVGDGRQLKRVRDEQLKQD